MPRLRLSAPDPVARTALRDVEQARVWLAAQPTTQAMRLLRALRAEIRGIDNAIDDPALRLQLLDVLRPALLQAEAGCEIRYAGRPLPLQTDEATAFELAWGGWWDFAQACLRPVLRLPPGEMLPYLHRAAIALREALRCHYLAACEAPASLPGLLHDILCTAEAMGLQRALYRDPELTHLGESSIAGEIAWAFLLLAIDPYRLTPAQLSVANRAFSRWRELVVFLAQPSGEDKEQIVPLAPLLGEASLPEDVPVWMEARAVRRKLKARIESLREGATPESLRLGRDLSPQACLQLLRDLSRTLRSPAAPLTNAWQTEKAGVDLVFGFSRLYTLLTGKSLQASELSLLSGRGSHERIAVFGFDNVANRVDHAGDTRVPAELWAVEDDLILRAAPAGEQILGTTLVGLREEKPALLIMHGLRQTVDGWLAGHLRGLPDVVGSGLLRTPPIGAGGISRQPVFFLAASATEGESLLLPSGIGMREGSPLALEESVIEHLRLGALLERGSNFLRFAYVRR